MEIIKTISVTHIGKVRDHNEDAVLCDNQSGLWIVADGMGGHASGEVASSLAIETVKNKLQAGADLKESIKTAHSEILSQGENNPEQKGMGTTIVAAHLKKDGFKIGWVGDSRAYIFGKKLEQLTFDHSFVQDMVFREVLTPEEAEVHPKRNLINRSLGIVNATLKVDTIDFKPKSSGVLFLCSDGVSDYVDSRALSEVFLESKSLEQLKNNISRSVMDTEAGDNFSFILIEFKVSKRLFIKNNLFR
ncbi:PP2C family protein-serine/threonine phosphatase [Aliikangiella sp. IMCC44653]